MPRRTFRQDPDTLEFYEVTTGVSNVHMVQGDIPAFVSPLDGSVVEGRRAYEEHMKRHNVVPFEPGSEKVHRPKEDPRPRRELVWELVDRASRGSPIRR